MVQAGRDQQAVGHAVDAAADDGSCSATASPTHVSPELNTGYSERHEDTDDETGDGGEDGNEPAPVEESEVVGQLGAVEPLPQNRGQQTHHDAGEHTVVDQRLVAVRVGLAFEDDRRHGLEHAVDDHVSDHGGQGGGTVGLLGPSDGDTHREDERQPGEHCLAGCGDDGRGGVHRLEPAEQVVLAEPQQDAGRGKYRDRQHQAAAEAL